jgi:hypothetical protein
MNKKGRPSDRAAFFSLRGLGVGCADFAVIGKLNLNFRLTLAAKEGAFHLYVKRAFILSDFEGCIATLP